MIDPEIEAEPPRTGGAHAAALFATAFTWPLLFVGGLVTTYRVGMAVPDWPTTFGINMFLYDMSQAAWGVLVEHGHRLYAVAVGVGTLVMAVWLSLGAGRRAWLPLSVGVLVAVALGASRWAAGRVDPLMAGIEIGGPVSLGLAAWFGRTRAGRLAALAWLAVAAVIVQGALGGLRVRWNSTDLAALHGCTAQLFFAGMVGLCLLTGRGARGDSKGPPPPGSVKLRRLALITLGLIYAQIVAGAWQRHYSGGLVVHSALAVGVLVHVLVLGLRVLGGRAGWPGLAPSARALLALTGLQIALGVASWWLLRPFDGVPKSITTAQALVRTAHQANGALVLAASVVLAMRGHRLAVRGRSTDPSPAAADRLVPRLSS